MRIKCDSITHILRVLYVLYTLFGFFFKFVYRFRISNKINHWGEFTYLFLRTEAVTAFEMCFGQNIRRRGAKWMHPVTLHIGKYSTDARSKVRPSYRVNDSDFVLAGCDVAPSCFCISLCWNKRFRPTPPSFWLSRDSCKSADCVTVRCLDVEVEYVYRLLNIRKRRCTKDGRHSPFLRTLLMCSVTHQHSHIKRRVREVVCCHNAGWSQWLTTLVNELKIQTWRSRLPHVVVKKMLPYIPA